MKKALSLILVVLMIISIVPLAMAETEYNYTIKTEFYGYDSTSGEWVPVTTASGGEKLKMIAERARKDVERLLDAKVYMELFVKVREDWRNDGLVMSDIGYDMKKLKK